MASTGAPLSASLVEFARALDPQNKVNVGDIAEIVAQSNELFQYMPWEMANGITGHTITQRIGLPTAYVRSYGEGISASHGEYAKVNEGMAMYEARSEIDEDLIALNAQNANFRLAEAIGFAEVLGQTWTSDFFYGDATQNPKKFNGLAPRYSATTGFANSQNVISAGGSANSNSSLWLLTLGHKSLYGIFPQGSTAGLQHIKKENQTVQTDTSLGGGRLEAAVDIFKWNAGVALHDWRWNVRICNIDSASLLTQTGAANLPELMVRAMYTLPSISTPPSTSGNPLLALAIPGRQVFACNRRTRFALHLQAMNKTNNQLSYDDFEGKKILHFAGIPVINVDQLLTTEANVA